MSYTIELFIVNLTKGEYKKLDISISDIKLIRTYLHKHLGWRQEDNINIHDSDSMSYILQSSKKHYKKIE